MVKKFDRRSLGNRKPKDRRVTVTLKDEGQPLTVLVVDMITDKILSTNDGNKMWKKCSLLRKALSLKKGDYVDIVWPDGNDSRLSGEVETVEGGWT